MGSLRSCERNDSWVTTLTYLLGRVRHACRATVPTELTESTLPIGKMKSMLSPS